MSQDGTDPNELLDPSDPAPWDSMTPIPPIPEDLNNCSPAVLRAIIKFYRKRAEIAEAENTRLKALVRDEELTPHCLGTKYFLTEVFDKVIASRATRTTQEKEEK